MHSDHNFIIIKVDSMTDIQKEERKKIITTKDIKITNRFWNIKKSSK